MTAARPQITTLKLEPGVPSEIALQYPSGMEVSGQYGPQILFTLTGNRRLYVPLEVGEEIRSLSLPPREPFLITKTQKQGGRGFEWKVERKPVQIEPTAPAPPGNRPQTQLESALKTAIAAAKVAEDYGKEIGYTVRFSEESIRCMANTVLINMGRAA